MNKKTAELFGMKVNYYEKGTGKSLLFLHGGRLRALTFEKTLIELSKKYHVIAPDIPGYGNSSTPLRPWSFKEYAQFFLEFLEKLKIDRVTVIGYSLGGGIAYHLASISSKVKRLILVDAAGIEVSKNNEIQKDVRRLLFYLTHPQYNLVFITLIKEYLFFSLKYLKDTVHMRHIRERLSESSSYTKSISMPTVILWGKNDEIFPSSIGQKLSQTIKDSKLIIVDGNHDWPLYKTKEFLRLLELYLK